MEEAERTSADGCTGALKNKTHSASWSAGFIGPMSAVLVLDLLVVVGNRRRRVKRKPEPLSARTKIGVLMMLSYWK